MDGQLFQNANKVVVKPHPHHRPLTSSGFFDTVLENSGPEVKTTRKRHKVNKIQFTLLTIAALCFVVGAYFSFQGIESVKLSRLQANSLMSLDAQATNSTSNVSSDGPSEAKVSASTLASYTVAPSLPRYLIIPKLNVNARVLAVGVNTKGEVGTPNDIYDTAWYNESAAPGQSGATLIDGHVSGWTAKGVFYGLKTLAPGDTVEIERGDNTIFTYKVIKSQSYPYNKVDMNAVMTPVVAGHPGLNLITCNGSVMAGSNEYSQRIIVFTEQV